ncbi:MAG: hypothetical protein DMG06_11055 [Acidobacteria bacterium]|nr:MAG: hypothetical protein DMG06_11055 [Acidobacteriota bacterium]
MSREPARPDANKTTPKTQGPLPPFLRGNHSFPIFGGAPQTAWIALLNPPINGGVGYKHTDNDGLQLRVRGRSRRADKDFQWEEILWTLEGPAMRIGHEGSIADWARDGRNQNAGRG